MTSALIVTAKMDAESFALLDKLRRLNFPVERNFLSAHITLFHHLPGDKITEIQEQIKDAVKTKGKIPLSFPDVRFLGRGTAISIESLELVELRAQLANRWDNYLTAQDRQKFNPHVTVQNKTEPAAAKIFYENLKSQWQPQFGFAAGLELWKYRNGPWELANEFLFEE